MRHNPAGRSTVVTLLLCVAFLASCHKQVATAPAAPAPAPSAVPTQPQVVAQARPDPAPRSAPAPASNAAPAPTLEQLFGQNVRDAYFDYDKADIRADAREALMRDAEFLRQYARLKIMIEGHCDERGGEEYNLALGERRAESARQFLVSQGIAGDRLQVVSYGKEKPFCTNENETCYQQNRRGHLDMAQ